MRHKPSKQISNVRFIDGPLDGHVQPVSLARCQLNDLVAIPINDNTFARLSSAKLEAESSREPQPATSIAIYTRDECLDETTYLYVGPALPRQFQMTDWRG